MNYFPSDVQAAHPQGRYGDQPQPVFKLTPEEEKILMECSKEGIVQRAIPMGIMFGAGGWIGAKYMGLTSQKFGAKPVIIGLGLLGYFIGRVSYSQICLRRCMELVPDGNMKKIFYGNLPDRGADTYYLPVETPKTHDPMREEQSTTLDIDIPAMSNFDTIPSDYYDTNVEKPEDQVPIKSYTSYDDLRRQNREEYSKKIHEYDNPVQQRYSNRPQDGPVVRRPTPQEKPPSGPIRGQQTKYGDTWDV